MTHLSFLYVVLRAGVGVATSHTWTENPRARHWRDSINGECVKDEKGGTDWGNGGGSNPPQSTLPHCIIYA